MTHSTNTHLVTVELDAYLLDNKYFDGEDEVSINEKILASWGEKFNLAISNDITSKFQNLQIDFILSDFKIESSNDRGACVFFHKIIIRDKANLESLNALVKTLVNYRKTNIYLDSAYAATTKFEGKSKDLQEISTKLKYADKDPGYFNPISLESLLIL